MRFFTPVSMCVCVSDRHRSPSVRSTNVYEERSLGIYNDDKSVGEEDFSSSGDRMTVWGNYLGMHARRQLAFGMRSFHDCVKELINPDKICGGLHWLSSLFVSLRSVVLPSSFL